MKNFLLSIILISLFPIYSLAVEDTPTSELVSQPEVKAEEITQLDQIEQERQKNFENQLGFTLPEYTDNPSYVITFTDPSPDASGVQLEIDGKEYIQINSPYTLPALTIGEHTLKFRFNDKDGNTQTLEYILIVVPRSPIITPPIVSEGSITLRGTGLSNSEIFIFLTSNTYNFKDVVTTNGEGEWMLVVQPEEGISEGIYTLTSFTRKYGYASEFSKPTVFEVGQNSSLKSDDGKKEIFFAFSSIEISKVGDTVTKNPDLVILLVSSFLIGGILFLLLRSLIKGAREENLLKRVESSIAKTGKKEEQKTLRELFESKEEKVEEKKTEIKPEEKEDVEQEEKKEDRVYTKENFLKEFKDVDPDENGGKEKTPKNIKVKVSLTSREE